VYKFWKNSANTIWTSSLILLAYSTFFRSFAFGIMDGARTNFLIDTLKLNGGQVLWLEGIRELPGLVLMFIAALIMRLPLSRSLAVSVILTGIGYALYAVINSYTALLAVVVFSSLGLHMSMPLHSSLAMCLATKDKVGRLLGTLSSVGSMASIAGIGAIFLISRSMESLSLRTYYIAGGFFFVVSGIIVAKIPKDVGATEIEPPRMLIKRHYWLYYVLILLQGSGQQVLDSFCILLLVKNFGLKVWNISLLILISSILSMSFAPYIGNLIDRLGERKTVPVSYVFLALCCAGFALIKNVLILEILVVAIRLLWMFGMGLSTYIRRISPPEELTPTLSTGISVNHITSVSMPLMAGWLLPTLGFEILFMATAIIIAISIPFALAMKVDPSLLKREERNL
jgi:predicted MFS family arabinose efflux permease